MLVESKQKASTFEKAADVTMMGTNKSDRLTKIDDKDVTSNHNLDLKGSKNQI